MKSLLKYERKVLNMKQIVNAVVSNEIENVKENEVMSNVVEVFGVNAVEVKEEVRKLVEVYKASGKRATLKEWGYKLDGHHYGKNALVAMFLKVLFEAKNDVFINTVLNEVDTTTFFSNEFIEKLYGANPKKWNIKLIDYKNSLAKAWAVYNLPILQEVMDALVVYMEKNPDYLDDCYAVEDMMDAIKDEGGFYARPFFQSYVSPYIVEFMREFNLEKLAFDEDEAEEIDLDFLEDVWYKFCNTELIEDILLDYYDSFMVEAVEEVLEYKGF